MVRRVSSGMNLQAAFDSIAPTKNGRPCYVCTSLGSMSVEDSETLLALLAGSASSRMIFEACKLAGLDTVTLASLRRHRRGECVSLA